jgi:predicted N-formylglutamate amidohydrolase
MGEDERPRKLRRLMKQRGENRLRPIVTCEHGGNAVPDRYASLFVDHQDLLATHRGWDPGSLDLAERLAARLGAPLYAARTTRLLVDLNRSPEAPDLFSEISRGLAAGERARVLAACYFPYRLAVESAVAAALADERATILHLSAHSFTPALDPPARDFDLGILFDPARAGEAAFARRLHAALAARAPHLSLRDNRPYLGTADGLTTHLRRRFPAERYLGIELEVNQRLPLGNRQGWHSAMEGVVDAVTAAVT